MWFLRQNTAGQEVPLGPFLDSTDGNTAETALSIASTDIALHKTGATAEVAKNSGGAAHVAGGRYYATLDATDTDTVGPLRISCHVAGALAVWLDCCFLSAAVYDVMFGATAPSTYAGGDTAGTTTLLSRVTGAVLLASGYTAPPDAADVAGAVRTELDTELGRLDAAVSTRSSHAPADVWAVSTRTLSAFAFSVTLSGVPDVNVAEINGAALTGNGSTVPWGPA